MLLLKSHVFFDKTVVSWTWKLSRKIGQVSGKKPEKKGRKKQSTVIQVKHKEQIVQNCMSGYNFVQQGGINMVILMVIMMMMVIFSAEVKSSESGQKISGNVGRRFIEEWTGKK